ncbi:MAG: multidrug resistance protein, partial [Bacteroidota bacterium]
WLLCLTKLDLSFAYPAGTLQYLFIFMGAWWWFDENISLLRIAGLVVIVIGVIVLALDNKK